MQRGYLILESESESESERAYELSEDEFDRSRLRTVIGFKVNLNPSKKEDEIEHE